MKKKSFLIPKILGILFIVSVITACPELPDFEIKTVDLKKLVPPATGESPQTKLENEKNLSYTIGEIEWFVKIEDVAVAVADDGDDGDDTDDAYVPMTGDFTEGNIYKAKFTLTAKEGFIFNDPVRFINKKGEPKGEVSSDNKTVTVTVEFDGVSTDEPIGELDLSYFVAFPFIGVSPAETFVHKKFNGEIVWEDKSGKKGIGPEGFKEETAYTAKVTLTANPGYIFKDTVFVYKREKDGDANNPFVPTEPITPFEGTDTEVTVTIKFPDTDKEPEKGQDFIAVANGANGANDDKKDSTAIYLIFKGTVKDTIVASQITISNGSGKATLKPGSSGVSSVNPYDNRKIWKISITTEEAGIVSVLIKGNDSVKNTPKDVRVYKTGVDPNLTPITAGALGITPPVADATPQQAVANGTGYEGGNITWYSGTSGSTPAGDTFTAGTVYRAIFNLYAKSNYTFYGSTGTWSNTDVAANKIKATPPGISLEAINPIDAITITLEFDATTGGGDSEKPVITTQPVSASYDLNAATVAALTVAATSPDGGDITYQWYRNTTTNSTSGGTPLLISGETGTSYTPPVTTAVITYYFVVVTNTKAPKNPASVFSDIAAITVNPPAATPVTAGNLGIVHPLSGKTPQGSVALGTGYTGGIITWTPAGATFAAGTVYSAQFTLTAANGYTFTGSTGTWRNNGATSITATPSGNGNTLTVTVTFAATCATGDYQVDLSTATVRNDTAFTGTYNGGFVIPMGTFDVTNYDKITVVFKGYAATGAEITSIGASSIQMKYHAVQVADANGDNVGTQWNVGQAGQMESGVAKDIPATVITAGTLWGLGFQNGGNADVPFFEVMSVVFHAKTASTFVPVTSITGVPTTGTVNTEVDLTGATAQPTTATNRTPIVWSLDNAGGTGVTGAAVATGKFTATAAGTITVRATIANGTAVGTPYTQTFTIDITAAAPANAATPQITTQPVGATYTVNAATVADLTVAATASDTGNGGLLSYQWYNNGTTNSNTGGTAITGETTASFTPPVTTAGTTYYYVIVTNTNNNATNNKTATATSNAAAITITAAPPANAQTPAISVHPQGATYTEGAPSVTPLSVTAGVSDGGDITYQWYSNTSNSNTGGTIIGGATTASYTPPVTTAGTTYYYVEVTNTNNNATVNKIVTVTSNAVGITVTASGGTGTATMTFTVKDLGTTVTITPTGPTTITKPDGTLTLTAIIPAGSGISVFNWYVDGDEKGNSPTITIKAIDYGIRSHDVLLVVEKGGVYYSKTGTFVVE
jgi:hypothetical protein